MRSQHGISLIDAMVALALFLLATATIGHSVVRQIRTGSTNSMHAVAYTLAAQELEELRGLDYEDIDDRKSGLREGAIEYVVATTVRHDTPEANMKEITVEVTWNEPDGSQNVQVRTIFTGVRR